MSTLTDNQIIQIFLPIINNALVVDGYTGVTVKQANQPTMQGIDTNKRYGWLGRNDVWDTMSSQMVHTETQYIESTWQMQALVLQNPATPNQYTASDLVNEVASIMQSDSTRTILNNNGIGILRVGDLINPYFVDDHDNFEASPSFDFVLIYQNTRTSINPIITTFTTDIVPI